MEAEEVAALRDGASALRLRSEMIANRTTKPEPPDVELKRSEFERHAALLEAMAVTREALPERFA